MSIERLLEDEDLFFQRLFAEEELSQRKTSKTASTYVNSNNLILCP